MGVFDSKSSKKQYTYTTNNVDNSNVAAADGGVALGQGASLTLTDPGAFDFGKYAIDAVGDAAARTAAVVESNQRAQKESLAEVVGLATRVSQQGTQQLTQDVFRYLMWGVVGVAGAIAVVGVATRKRAA